MRVVGGVTVEEACGGFVVDCVFVADIPLIVEIVGKVISVDSVFVIVTIVGAICVLLVLLDHNYGPLLMVNIISKVKT